MTGRTGYGDLIRDTAEQLAAGCGQLTGRPFANRARAEAAVLAYRDLANSLARVGRELLGSADRIAGLRQAAHPDPGDLAMVHLVDDLAGLGRQRPFDAPVPAEGAGARWASAARSAGAAADLLGTHRGPAGQWRTPSPVVDDPDVRMIGYAELASLAAPLAGAGPVLARRAVEAGADWARVKPWMQRAEAVLASTSQVRGLGRTGNVADAIANGDRLAAIEVARPAVRLGDPVVELGDPLARLHRAAWQLTQDPRSGIATLDDFAAVAVVLQEAAGATLARLAAADSQRGRPTATWERDADTLRERVAAWRQVRLELRALRTPTPGQAGVRADAHTARGLLIEIAGPLSTTQPIRALPVLMCAERSLGDIARWNVVALDHLAASGDLYITGAALPRELLSENPSLVQARLRNSLAPAPPGCVDPVRDAYASVRRVQEEVGARQSPRAVLHVRGMARNRGSRASAPWAGDVRMR